MKTCPYCAESIQDAAIVCKHCRKDLTVTPPAAVQGKPTGVRWGRLILILLAIVAVPVIAVQCGSARAKYLDFDQRRQAWHQKCDRYVDVRLTDPMAKACNDELLALTAEAKREGWMK